MRGRRAAAEVIPVRDTTCEEVPLGFAMPLMDDVRAESEWVLSHARRDSGRRELPGMEAFATVFAGNPRDSRNFTMRLARARRLAGQDRAWGAKRGASVRTCIVTPLRCLTKSAAS